MLLRRPAVGRSQQSGVSSRWAEGSDELLKVHVEGKVDSRQRSSDEWTLADSRWRMGECGQSGEEVVAG